MSKPLEMACLLMLALIIFLSKADKLEYTKHYIKLGHSWNVTCHTPFKEPTSWFFVSAHPHFFNDYLYEEGRLKERFMIGRYNLTISNDKHINTLQINKTDENHAGQYACIPDRTTVEHQQFHELILVDVHYVEKGKSWNMSCNTSSQQPMKWLFQGVLSNGKNVTLYDHWKIKEELISRYNFSNFFDRQMNTYTMMIPRADVNHAGTYSCTYYSSHRLFQEQKNLTVLDNLEIKLDYYNVKIPQLTMYINYTGFNTPRPQLSCQINNKMQTFKNLTCKHIDDYLESCFLSKMFNSKDMLPEKCQIQFETFVVKEQLIIKSNEKDNVNNSESELKEQLIIKSNEKENENNSDSEYKIAAIILGIILGISVIVIVVLIWEKIKSYKRQVNLAKDNLERDKLDFEKTVDRAATARNPNVAGNKYNNDNKFSNDCEKVRLLPDCKNASDKSENICNWVTDKKPTTFSQSLENLEKCCSSESPLSEPQNEDLNKNTDCFLAHTIIITDERTDTKLNEMKENIKGSKTTTDNAFIEYDNTEIKVSNFPDINLMNLRHDIESKRRIEHQFSEPKFMRCQSGILDNSFNVGYEFSSTFKVIKRNDASFVQFTKDKTNHENIMQTLSSYADQPVFKKIFNFYKALADEKLNDFRKIHAFKKSEHLALDQFLIKTNAKNLINSKNILDGNIETSTEIINESNQFESDANVNQAMDNFNNVEEIYKERVAVDKTCQFVKTLANYIDDDKFKKGKKNKSKDDMNLHFPKTKTCVDDEYALMQASLKLLKYVFARDSEWS